METSLDKEKAERSLFENIILGVAHELNNPNTFVRMNAVNIKKMINLLSPCFDEYASTHPDAKFGPYTLPEMRAKMLSLNESTLEATMRIIAIADKLKQIASYDLHANTPVSIRDVVERLLIMHKFLIDKWAVLGFKSDAADSLEIKGHQLQIEQAFSILLTNACDAIAEKFGEGHADGGRLDVELERLAGKILIRFRDNGCGMDDETIKKIFNPYFTTKPQGVGDGLGLPLCKAIIERHGGNIEVKSIKGMGTEFMVYLPKPQG